MPDFSHDQLRALDVLERFLADRSGARAHVSLHGLAGTGKTFVMAELARRYPDATLCAPTAKAAAVLRARSGLPVSTIHSAIYDFRGLHEDEETGAKRPVFTAKENAGLRDRVVFMDESSMVGSRIARDLLDTGARVIASGDPGQLKPVADDQFFTRPDVTLTEPHRQALESAVIRQAHAIRTGRAYAPDGPDFRVVTRATDAELGAVGVALCWRNATRRALNQRRRSAMGHEGRVLRIGEPVMCLRNDYALRIFNGEIYELARDRAPGDDVLLRTQDGREVEALNAVIEGFDDSFEELRHEESMTPLAQAYAATVHKSQGSQWPSVLLVDEFGNGDDRAAFLYTGVTRAEKSVIMVRAR